jgi:hypothetical protein
MGSISLRMRRVFIRRRDRCNGSNKRLVTVLVQALASSYLALSMLVLVFLYAVAAQRSWSRVLCLLTLSVVQTLQ